MSEEVERRLPRLRWWREVAYVIAFYFVYSAIRIRLAGSKGLAFSNAKKVIRVERLLGSYHEETVQDWFLRWPNFIKLWNVYYGSFHFIVSIAALVYMFMRMKHRYPLWRNTLACMTGLALIGFAFFPLMPPRLLPASYGFVDTLDKIGGLWSFQDLKNVANDYAAMPSLHIGWATWSSCILLPAVRQRWAKALVIAYPLITLFAIVVTANHFWIDALGGLAVLTAGYFLARLLTDFLAKRRAAPAEYQQSE